MTYTIVTRYTTTDKGAARIVAKGHGKQRTVVRDYSQSWEQNHAAAAGTLLNVLLDPKQQAKVRHPSGGQRVRHIQHGNAHHTFTVDV
jgi:hypothetical protein